MIWNWSKVSSRNPCSICGKPDWCSYASEKATVLCMRVESGRPSRNEMGGWLHTLDDQIIATLPPAKFPQIQKPSPDFQKLWYDWYLKTDFERLQGFAASLGVQPIALRALNCVWAPESRAWAFPMTDVNGKILGIRLRSEEGKKWSVRGGHQGLFIPTLGLQSTLYVCEGPTDCAAAYSLGLYSVGRPSCSSGVELIKEFIRVKQIKKVIIISDNDGPGLRGSQNLRNELNLPTWIFTPPTKDLRDFVRSGGTLDTIKTTSRLFSKQ